MYTKLPIMMMKKNDYTEINEDHPGGYGQGQDSVTSSAVVAKDRRNRNRFWEIQFPLGIPSRLPSQRRISIMWILGFSLAATTQPHAYIYIYWNLI